MRVTRFLWVFAIIAAAISPYYANSEVEFSERFVDDDISMNDMRVVDLDQDGDYDIAAAERLNRRRIFWWENDGVFNFARRMISELGTYKSALDIADMDNDGDLDIVIGESRHWLVGVAFS